MIDGKVINNNTNDDAKVLESYLRLLGIDDGGFYVDIGAFNSNVPSSVRNKADMIVLCECHPHRQHQVLSLEQNEQNFLAITEKVTPYNVVELLENKIKNHNKYFPDRQPDLVDIDIDGYDYFVLESLLQKFTPTLIVAEINEKIPPPIKFTINYHENYWSDLSHYYGASICKFGELFEKHGYDIVNLTFNNVYAIKREKNILFRDYTPEECYDELYRNAGWETAGFWYNKNVKEWLTLPTDDAILAIEKYFHECSEQTSFGYEIYK